MYNVYNPHGYAKRLQYEKSFFLSGNGNGIVDPFLFESSAVSGREKKKETENRQRSDVIATNSIRIQVQSLISSYFQQQLIESDVIRIYFR